MRALVKLFVDISTRVGMVWRDDAQRRRDVLALPLPTLFCCLIRTAWKNQHTPHFSIHLDARSSPNHHLHHVGSCWHHCAENAALVSPLSPWLVSRLTSIDSYHGNVDLTIHRLPLHAQRSGVEATSRQQDDARPKDLIQRGQQRS